jgi:parallel beta-helix repeat protein
MKINRKQERFMSKYEKKKLVYFVFTLLITCIVSPLSIIVQGEEQGVSYTFSEDAHRLINCKSLVFSLFVSPDGSDSNPGTEDSPFESISMAAVKAQAGDIVLVRQGTYKENVEFKNSGTEDRPILFVAEDGVVVEGSDDLPYFGAIFNLDWRRHVTISGFHLKDSNWFGIFIHECSYITVDSCFVENTEASGIIARDSDHILIINNKVRNACAYDGDPPDRGAQECISMSNVDTFQVIYNEVYESLSGYAGGRGSMLRRRAVTGRSLITCCTTTSSWRSTLTAMTMYYQTLQCTATSSSITTKASLCPLSKGASQGTFGCTITWS